mmetsp:Transcript_113315/g.321053  ORF Transcript_113315/g.321053 Transcript_113315/m.321053 type:complete len:200 (+) Transcript_113315:2-601(+)
MGLGWMTGASEGSCVDAGYTQMVADRQVQAPGSPMPVLVRVMALRTSCHCHSYERIDCDATGDALYEEHITEIESYCAEVVAGQSGVCPYRCFQPFEVLHLHYMECQRHPQHALFLQVQNTSLCHKAAMAPNAGACGHPPELVTCGELKATYKSHGCCGNPGKPIPELSASCGELQHYYRDHQCCGSPGKEVPMPHGPM